MKSRHSGLMGQCCALMVGLAVGPVMADDAVLPIDDPPTPSTVRCEAPLSPPSGRLVHGMGQWEQYNARLIEELKQPSYLHASEKGALTGYAAVTPLDPAPADRGRASPQNSLVGTNRSRIAAASEAGSVVRAWDNAATYRSQTGPGGTEWDAQYRSFIQTDESATSKGLPTHAEAAAQILADAAKHPENLRRHQGWVLFIKHFSQAYRPDPATADLKRLFERLAALESGKATVGAGLPFDADSRLTIYRDVVYGRSHPDLQKLDAYLVESAEPTPVVIEIHGGGWRRGSKSQFTYPGNLIDAILNCGISVISIDYRLTPQHTLPAPMEDVARAVQFVRSKAATWNLDPSRIAALGGSAGAHLGAWVALHDDGAKPDGADLVGRLSTRLTCFVAISGPMDLTRVRPTELAQQALRGQDFANAFTAAFGCTAEQYEQDPDVRRRIREASPLFLVTPDDPPGFVMAAWGEELAGRRDPPVPAVINDPHSAWQSVLLAEAMLRAGAKITSRVGPEVARSPEANKAAILEFLCEHLAVNQRVSVQQGSARPAGEGP